MGMPSRDYSFYPLLYNLASPARPYYRSALDTISSFSLFAFVICSPDEDDGSRDVLSRHFSYLDAATADRLLFYAPIDEPREWRRQRESCPMARSLRSLHDRIRGASSSGDPGNTEHALALTLGIGLDELPVIVLTADPRSPNYVVLRTSRNHLRQQLVALGDFAQDLPSLREREINPGAEALTLDALRSRRIDTCGGVASPELLTSLAESLHQVLSVAISGGHDGVNDRRVRASASQTLATLREQIEQSRRSLRLAGPDRARGSDPAEGSSSPEQSRLLDLHERLAAYVALAPSGGARHGRDVPAGWEPESTRWLRLGDRVAEFLDRSSGACEKGAESTDYSPAAVCWSKAFEAELNHSLGHWVRGILGVDLPAHYGKFQEGVRAVFVGNEGQFTVDFNRRRRPGEDDWRPIELGVLQSPVYHYLRHRPSAPLPGEQHRLLRTKWEAVRQVRNDVCHAYRVERERAAALREAVDELNRCSILSALVELKRQLQGRSDGATFPDRETTAPPGDQGPGPEPAVAAKWPWWKFW